jgi:uncharacterized protein (UPF0332 family)
MRDEETKTLVEYRLGHAQATLEDAKYLRAGRRSTHSIINRAYYAMFYAALALLQKTAQVPSKHTGVIGLFDSEFVLKGLFPKEMSKALHRAFDLRQASDYRVRQSVPIETVDELLGQADEFVQKVRGYLTS